jgi:hypothetical protein
MTEINNNREHSRELTEAELGHVVGGLLTHRKAGEKPLEDLTLGTGQTSTGAGARGTGGQFGP